MLAHATLEPQNCTVEFREDGCHVYVPTQVQQLAQATAAQAAGLPPEKVFVHTTFLGGGFGRRLEVDFIPAAVECAKAASKPVKLLWTREDDTTHDKYRPPARNTLSGAFDAGGKLSAVKMHLVAPSITSRWAPAAVANDVVDPFAVEAAHNFPYDVPNVYIDYLQHEIGIDVGYWRSVSHALNCFTVESFMDELAHAGAASIRTSSAAACSTSSRAGRWCWTRLRRRPVGTRAERPSSGHRADVGLRHVSRAGRGSVGGGQPAQGPSHRLRDRLRADGESRHRACAGRRQHRLRPHRRAVRRDQHRERPRARNRTSTTIGCCASTRRRRSRCTVIDSTEKPGGMGEPASRWSRRRSATRSTRRRASGSGRCRSRSRDSRCRSGFSPTAGVG